MWIFVLNRLIFSVFFFICVLYLHCANSQYKNRTQSSSSNNMQSAQKSDCCSLAESSFIQRPRTSSSCSLKLLLIWQRATTLSPCSAGGHLGSRGSVSVSSLRYQITEYPVHTARNESIAQPMLWLTDWFRHLCKAHHLKY